jgi:hypothetical protein
MRGLRGYDAKGASDAPFAQHRLSSLINLVHLKHVFRQINAYCRNVHRGRSSRFKWSNIARPLWHVDAVPSGAAIPLVFGEQRTTTGDVI